MDEKKLTVQIGRRFRAFRLTQGLSQKQIAVLLGVVTHSNISRLERGAIHRFGVVFLKNCRAKFSLSIDWLLTGQGAMVLPEAESKLRAAKLRCQKGRKKGPSQVSASVDQRSLRRKLDELTTSLAREPPALSTNYRLMLRIGTPRRKGSSHHPQSCAHGKNVRIARSTHPIIALQ